MPKKFGTNSKKQEALERKVNTQQEEINKKAKAKEDAYWKESDDKVLKQLDKKKEKENKKAEALKRKQENKLLLEEEEKNIKNQFKEDLRVAKPKVKEEKPKKIVTAYIDSDEDELNLKVKKDSVVEPTIEDLDLNKDYENKNFKKMEEVKECQFEFDLHPEKRFKKALNDYIEKNLPEYKEKYRGQRKRVLINLITKDFEKAEENPFVKQKMIKQDDFFKASIDDNSKQDEEL